MIDPLRRRRDDESGFTLVELLVAIVILGLIAFSLTEAVILGLKTTDATAASSSRSVAAQTLTSYFTDDVQSAETVDTTAPSCLNGGPVAGSVFLHLAWTDRQVRADQQVRRDVSYALDPPGASEQELVRWSCSDGGARASRILGHFTRDGSVGAAEPVAAACGAAPACPSTPAASPPATVTLTIQAAPSLTLTVHRRAG